ncbi:hypothetical protein HNQ94_002005 [Salirhabdus euzebyi]|uniref:N-acetyltransferase domain-containing protein n=1 Tax=Salirhabdus euzebyi TaxID=394506 RepID=A0A841Q572_9BACI|nr:GNAT family N-acetyltransferase [Salirhabdus euzebyi]MBB6453556.1 hypothetical protein [Salirhabdus euzebyi]
MTNGLLQMRKLTKADYSKLTAMDTGIEDDYVVRIFDNLLESKEHALYGLFDDEKMLTIAGYSIFANHFAMLGRLRSDRRYLARGNATTLLLKMIEDLKADPNIFWIGANTEVHNGPARRVLTKIGLPADPPSYPVKLQESMKIQGKPGPLWQAINEREEKRKLLLSLQENALRMFPYECYYPFPFHESLFSNDYLDESTFYANDDKSRFFMMKEDQKGNLYAHMAYFWNDHFEQPGLWDTVNQALESSFTEHQLWIDVSKQAYPVFAQQEEIFDIQKPWMLHGIWAK